MRGSCLCFCECVSHVDADKQNWGTLLFFRGKGISKNERSPMHTHIHAHTCTHTLRHTSSLSNPSTNSPLVEGVHCFSFILISPSPLFKIHIRFSLSWPQSEALKQSITLLMLFVSPDLSLSMESTPLSWSRVGERQDSHLGQLFLVTGHLNPPTTTLPLRKSALLWIRALSLLCQITAPCLKQLKQTDL